MPFIDAKVTTPITPEQEEKLKTQLGQAVQNIPGKTEQWLMVGFQDRYTLYFQGNQDQPAALICVRIFGSAGAEAYEAMTRDVTRIFHETLSIPENRIYVQYEECSHWGWNGSNF